MSGIQINNIQFHFQGWDDVKFPTQGINPSGA